MHGQTELEKTIESTYRNLAEKHFKDLYIFCYQTGSFVYGGGTPGKSDLDVTVIFKDSVYNLPPRELLNRIEDFIVGYLKLHEQTGYNPDITFPGEYVTEAMFIDAIAGRGFHVENGRLFLPKASREYYLEDSERGFRAWLSQSAFNKFLAGDRNTYKDKKIKGWCTILKFILKDIESQAINVSDILGRLRIFGVHDDYWNFGNMESLWIIKSLEKLSEDGFVIKSEGYFSPQPIKLHEWESEVAYAITTGLIKKSSILIGAEETVLLSKYANEN